jgi:haloacid dehalogenase superfamily, subfamily IA, variant 3 with third motif having DD or ED/haloacid dehalogenase superfamily, subfamily IA, variant 1 with third motif having Dx(3-4)D or Dx(3-4)E
MGFDASRVKAICFDVDGTLSDTDDEWVAQIEQRLRVLKHLMPASELHALARWLIMASETPMNAVYHWLDALSLDDTFARLYERMIQKRKHTPKDFWLMAGADGLLADLSARFPLAVVSARDELTTGAFIDQFSLRHLFAAVATSQTCLHTKPYPQPVLWAAEKMRVAPQHCLMVGDTTVDILAGKAAGAQTVGLLCGFGTERELRRAGANLILKDLREIADYLK